MKLYNLDEVTGTRDFGGLVKPVISRVGSEMACGTFELTPGESLKDFESHNSDEIFFIASGTLTVLSKSSDTITATAGQIVLIPRGEIHLSRNDGKEKAIVFWCNRD